MSDHVDQLRQVVTAGRVTMPCTVTWFGARCAPPPRRLRQQLSPEDLRVFAHLTLRDRVYEDAYCLGQAQPTVPRESRTGGGGDGHFAERLGSANAGQGTWAPGWRVQAAGDALLGVSSGGLQVWVRPQDCRSVDDGSVRELSARPEIGDELAIRLPEGSFDLSPGYYTAFSTQPMPPREQARLVRVYFACRPAAAPAFVRTLTSRLDSATLPFRLKVLADPQDYRRRDAAVLYLPRAALDTATPHLARVVAELRSALEREVPLFTRRLAPGVALAEEPETQESFGQHRAALVAEGVVRAAEQGRTRPTDRLDTVLATWAEADVDVRRPHLRPGSDDAAYDELAGAVAEGTGTARPDAGHPRRRLAPAPRAATAEHEGTADQTAQRLASRLVADAVWHEDRCTWLSLVPTVDDRGRPSLAHGSVGASLYDGSAGIALFLAASAVLAEEPEAARTARGAARNALASCAEPSAAGLYVGATGVALAAAAVGALLGDDELAVHALDVATASRDPDGPDYLSGRAGAVVGMLALHRLLSAPEPLRLAEEYGDELLDAAMRTSHGWCWPTAADAGSPALTGLSHGAAGVAAALVELHVATGSARFASAAREAFAYERSWFSPEVGNWPDLRDRRTRSRRVPAAAFRAQWCHGAPGIALSRLRASAVLGDTELEREAAVALRTTTRETRAAMEDGSLGFSLCHGLVGNSDVLLDRAEALGREDDRRAARLVDEVAAVGTTRHSGPGRAPWPCGIPVPDQEVPGLLIGLAGIGYHYLRHAHRALLPSLLLVQPVAFADRITRLSRAPQTRPRAAFVGEAS